MSLIQKKFRDLPLIEILIFGLIVLFAIGYITLVSDFAEQHIILSFLNFPVFIGEILLFGCLVMCAFLVKRGTIVIERWHYVLSVYIIWLFLKVSWGYYTFGPLALRNAALFYYPLFAVLTYYSFRSLVFSRRTLSVIFFPLAIVLGVNQVNDYYLLGYLVVFSLVSFYSGQRSLQVGGVALILWQLYRHQFLLAGSRSHIVGQLAAVLFLAFFMGAIFIPQRTRWWIGPLIGLGVLGVLALGLWKWSDPNALQSMSNIGKLKGRYQAFDAEIEQKKADFKSGELQAQLYHSNTVGAVGVSADKVEDFRKALSDQNQFLLAAVLFLAFFMGAIFIPQRTRRWLGPLIGLGVLGVLALGLWKWSDPNALPLQQFKIDDTIKQQISMDRDNMDTRVLFRSLETAENNIFFRIFIWRDMILEMLQKKAFLGINFGQPQRSQSLEILGWAKIEWHRDGWITPHNSFFHMIYRAGIIGLFLVLALFGLLVYLVRAFFITKSLEGGLLLSAIVYWVVIANFLVFLELPYNAIPFWSFVGATVAFANRKLVKSR